MKFSITLPIDHVHAGAEFIGPDAIAGLIAVAEEAGFDACTVTDHPVPTGRWLDHGGHHAQDPFVMLAMVAATSRTLRLHTGLVVLPYRNPFITARAVASLDAFSGGRVLLGVGAGYLKAEFKALGVPFDTRNDLMDEYLRALKAAWTQDEFTFQGTGYEALGNRILPRPVQSPHPPIWIGGNSRRAIRRAAELGDGWSPFAAGPVVAATSRTAEMDDPDELRAGIAYLREHAASIGRTAPIDIVTSSGHDAERVAALQDLGVSWVIASVPGDTRAEWSENARRFGDEIVAKFKARREA